MLGCIFNKLPLEGFYNVQACKEAVSSYFTLKGSIYCPYGFIPMLTIIKKNTMEVKLDDRDPGSAVPTSENETIKTDIPSVIPVAKSASPTVEAMVDAFLDNVDFGQLLRDIIKFHVSLLNAYLLSCVCRVAIL